MFYFRLTFVPSFFPPSFVKFDYFLFRLLKFERTFHYSFLDIKTKKKDKKIFRAQRTSRETLHTFASTFISTFVFDNEHDSASSFRQQETSRSSQGRDNSQPAVTDRQSGVLPQKFPLPVKKFNTPREVNSPVKETWKPRPSSSGRVFSSRRAKTKVRESGSGGDTSARQESVFVADNFPRETLTPHLPVANFSTPEKFRPIVRRILWMFRPRNGFLGFVAFFFFFRKRRDSPVTRYCSPFGARDSFCHNGFSS